MAQDDVLNVRVHLDLPAARDITAKQRATGAGGEGRTLAATERLIFIIAEDMSARGDRVHQHSGLAPERPANSPEYPPNSFGLLAVIMNE